MTSRSRKLSLHIPVRRASTLAVLSMASVSLWGQSFTTCGSNICSSPTTANVGIANISPTNLLDIGDNAFGTVLNGKHLTVTATAANSGVNVGQGNANRGRMLWIYNSNPASAYMSVEVAYGANPLILQSMGGNVGIGTTFGSTPPARLLQVAGVIGAEEVIVSSTGADYVLQPGYQLKPLAEVGEYIKRYRHLPDIPSAKEVKEQGLSLGEMQSKLLAKVEELTLHMIQAEQKSERLDAENRELRDRVARLENQTKAEASAGPGKSMGYGRQD